MCNFIARVKSHKSFSYLWIILFALLTLLFIRPLVGSSRNPSKYIKYNPDELEEALGNLFAKK